MTHTLIFSSFPSCLMHSVILGGTGFQESVQIPKPAELHFLTQNGIGMEHTLHTSSCVLNSCETHYPTHHKSYIKTWLCCIVWGTMARKKVSVSNTENCLKCFLVHQQLNVRMHICKCQGWWCVSRFLERIPVNKETRFSLLKIRKWTFIKKGYQQEMI